jgi:hypothetical protein
MLINANSLNAFASDLVGAFNIKALTDYSEKRVETGGFLHAILEGDLYRAVMISDNLNQPKIYYITMYIINTLPEESYGSKKRVKSWLKNM